MRTYKSEHYDAFYPKVMACNGEPPHHQIQDRAIEIALQRKRPDQTASPLGPESRQQAHTLMARLERWAADNGDGLEAKLLAFDRAGLGLDDRAADNWALPLTIAALAGPEWAERAHSAAVAISRRTRDADQASPGEAVLQQIRAQFEERNCAAIAAEALAQELVGAHGQRLSAKGLAGLLKPFGIKSRKKRDHMMYFRADFEDAFARYLPDDINDDPNDSSDVPS